MKTKTLLRLRPIFWSIAIFILAQGLTLLVASHENAFLTKHSLSLPTQPPESVSIWPAQTTSPSGEVTQTPAVSSAGPDTYLFPGGDCHPGNSPLCHSDISVKGSFQGNFCLFILLEYFRCRNNLAAVNCQYWYRACHRRNMVFQPQSVAAQPGDAVAMVALGEVFGRLISPWTAMILLAVLADL